MIVPNVKQCASCRWHSDLEHRHDQVFCMNEDSPEALSEVEATGCCERFEPDEKTAWHSLAFGGPLPIRTSIGYRFEWPETC